MAVILHRGLTLPRSMEFRTEPFAARRDERLRV
jgi:hypothetical protein